MKIGFISAFFSGLGRPGSGPFPLSGESLFLIGKEAGRKEANPESSTAAA
jgi:hypothetical protein